MRTGKELRCRPVDGSADKNAARNCTVHSPASSSKTQNDPNIFGDEPTKDICLTARPAARATPDAVVISGNNSDNDSIENYDVS